MCKGGIITLEKAIVCFSGGHSSALVAIETVREYGKENVILLNHNISSKVEHKDIKRFKEDISNYLDIPITYANATDFEQMTPLEVCKKKKAFNVGTMQKFCTGYLKTEPFYKYLETIPKSPKVHVLYGFDMSEPDRINRRTDIIRAMGYTPKFPLAEWHRTIEKVEDIGIPRPVTYRIYKHANCQACLRAGMQHWYCTYCLRPDLFEEGKKAEEEIGYSIIEGKYLGELEPKYREMRNDKSICPSDKGNSSTFWARVEQTLPEQLNMMPCDCSF